MRLITLLALLVCLLGATAEASTFTTTHINSDATYTTLVGGSMEPLLDWVAEGRIASAGDSNKSNLGPSTGAPAQTANLAWSSGTGVNWTVAYNAGTNLASFTLGGNSALTYTVVPKQNLNLYIRAAAVGGGSGVTGLSSTVNNLNFTAGTATGLVGDSASASNPASVGSVVDYIGITGTDYNQSFTLTGTTTFGWTGAAPSGSRLAFEVKLTQVTATPEPGTILLSLGGLLLVMGAARYSRRTVTELQ